MFLHILIFCAIFNYTRGHAPHVLANLRPLHEQICFTMSTTPTRISDSEACKLILRTALRKRLLENEIKETAPDFSRKRLLESEVNETVSPGTIDAVSEAVSDALECLCKLTVRYSCWSRKQICS